MLKPKSKTFKPIVGERFFRVTFRNGSPELLLVTYVYTIHPHAYDRKESNALKSYVFSSSLDNQNFTIPVSKFPNVIKSKVGAIEFYIPYSEFVNAHSSINRSSN